MMTLTVHWCPHHEQIQEGKNYNLVTPVTIMKTGELSIHEPFIINPHHQKDRSNKSMILNKNIPHKKLI